jgi:hypothetical protein
LFVSARGEPLTALGFLRHTAIGQHVPTEALVDTIRRVVRCRLEDQLRERCQPSNAVNLAVDGWADPRGRRYQGVTAQLVRYDADCSAETAVVALKEIKSIHQTRDELQAVLRHVRQGFVIGDKTISICTDRAAMNERAFRGELVGGFAIGAIWLLFVCHLLSNLLSRFVENIPDVVTPIFRPQQRFRKRGPFLSFLESRDVRARPSRPTARSDGTVPTCFSAPSCVCWITCSTSRPRKASRSMSRMTG